MATNADVVRDLHETVDLAPLADNRISNRTAIDGGIRGSYPCHGEYGAWSVLSWATKFFADAMMDYLGAS